MRIVASALGRALLLVGGGAFGAQAAVAETLTFECTQREPEGSPPTLVVYEGTETGTLTVPAPLGGLALPASLEERDSEVEGESFHAIGIRASGPVTAPMPVKAELEACVGSKHPGVPLDADMVAYYLLSCSADAKQPMVPTAITASVELVDVDGTAMLTINRTYDEPTALPGGSLTLMTWPIPDCKLASRQ